jgi:bifunctional non-homologous end joining protein LigD
MDKNIKINRNPLHLTNLQKMFWSEDKITKGDLIEYYDKISKFILPYLKDRPESLLRHPNGYNGKSFFQKDVDHMPPEWVKTQRIYSGSNKEYINYLICQDKATLLYMINLGCIEINPWFSRTQNLDYPDFIAMDLDPLDISFDAVIETAKAVKEVLDKAKAKGYCKTSGATGIHIYIPLGAKYDYEIAKEFGHVIAQEVHNLIPEITSIERMTHKRKKKVYIDFLQNRKGQTLACAYSARPKPHATVSTPLEWKELKKGLTPEMFTIKNIFKRLEKKGDLFKGALGKGVDIMKCLKNMGH